MRSLASRLARLERMEVRTSGRCGRIVQLGRVIKRLPADFVGPRHLVAVNQLPPDSGGHPWFEWEERPEPAPAGDQNDERVLKVSFVG